MIFSKWVARAALAISFFVVGVSANATVTFEFDSDGLKITGAKNIWIDGSFYDVVFDDVGVFPTTGQSTPFSFAQALVEQVFTPIAPLSLDGSPSVLRGCTSATVCKVAMPYGIPTHYAGDMDVVTLIAVNFSTQLENSGNLDFVSSVTIPPGTYALSPCCFSTADYTYARWYPHVSAVPEPETYALMLAGLGLIGSAARRRKAKQA